MYIRNQRDFDLFLDLGDGSAASMSGTATLIISQPHSSSSLIWSNGGSYIPGIGLGHRLDGDRGAAADLHPADLYGP